jgi:hypothetical protein
MEIKKKKHFKIIIYLIALVVLAAAAIYFLSQARVHYGDFRTDIASPQIEEDMPIGFVISHFGISEQEVFSELNLPDSRWNRRYTILEVCQKKRLDCTAVVSQLNSKIAK